MKKNKFVANELCLSYRRNAQLSISYFVKVNNSKALARAFRSIWNKDEVDIRESFYALYLNNSLDVVGYYRIADGGVDAVAVDIKLIMSCALLTNASGIAIAHNHPSGTLKPSNPDRVLTKRIATACGIMDVRLIDHIILTDESYYSFADNRDL